MILPDDPSAPATLAGTLGGLATFMSVAVAATASGVVIANAVVPGGIRVDRPTIGEILLSNAALVCLSLLLPAFATRRLFGSDWKRFGIGGRYPLRRMASGVVSGTIAIAALTGSMAAMGVVQFAGPRHPAIGLAGYGIAYVAIFASTAVAEEGLFRGYLLIELSRAIGFAPAAVLTSAAFAALHLIHGNESPLGLLQVGLFGLAMAISVARTGGLWFALGFDGAGTSDRRSSWASATAAQRARARC